MKNLFSRFFDLLFKPIETTKKISPPKPESINIWDFDYKTRCELLRKRREAWERDEAEYEEQQGHSSDSSEGVVFGGILGF
jgi:hypothetical protein